MIKVGAEVIIGDSTGGSFEEKREYIIEVDDINFMTESGYIFDKETKLCINKKGNFYIPYIRAIKSMDKQYYTKVINQKDKNRK